MIGAVADDFTGASDAASFLAGAGLSTVLCSGIPEKGLKLREGTQAVVVALKSRTVPAAEAVRDTLEAFDRLKELGARQLYFKYCATFDSTEKGNIGPVADAVLEKYGIPFTLLCPALPVNGRTVKAGILYVNGTPLSESHMRNHPLTPMRESRITKLMEMQSAHKAAEISAAEMNRFRGKPAPEVLEAAAKAAGKQDVRYLVPEWYEDGHGDLIAELFGELPFLTGGSGLCGALGKRLLRGSEAVSDAGVDGSANVQGKALLLAGSCSKVTLEQIADYRAKGAPALQILPERLLDGTQTVETALRFAEEAGDGALIYSSQPPEEMKKSQELGAERVAEAIEGFMSELAARAARNGWSRIISAGGETSGAVTKALGYRAFYIGESVAPGVPVMTPVANPSLRLVLKSGGFGQQDFFARAAAMTASPSQDAAR